MRLLWKGNTFFSSFAILEMQKKIFVIPQISFYVVDELWNTGILIIDNILFSFFFSVSFLQNEYEFINK